MIVPSAASSICITTARNVSRLNVRHLIRTKTTSSKPPQKATPQPKNVTVKVEASEASEAKFDPHKLASDMISASDTSQRIPGTESILKLTAQQRMANVGLAGLLVTFVGGVWWYSMTSVGRSDGGIEELQKEADVARLRQNQKSEVEDEISELLEYERTGVDEEEEREVMIAIAAPEDVAEEEERKSLEARGVVTAAAGRPLWKKIVFFWRKE